MWHFKKNFRKSDRELIKRGEKNHIRLLAFIALEKIWKNVLTNPKWSDIISVQVNSDLSNRLSDWDTYFESDKLLVTSGSIVCTLAMICYLWSQIRRYGG